MRKTGSGKEAESRKDLKAPPSWLGVCDDDDEEDEDDDDQEEHDEAEDEDEMEKVAKHVEEFDLALDDSPEVRTLKSAPRIRIVGAYDYDQKNDVHTFQGPTEAWVDPNPGGKEFVTWKQTGNRWGKSRIDLGNDGSVGHSIVDAGSGRSASPC